MYRNPFLSVLFAVVLLSLHNEITAQDLENLVKGKPFSVSGGASLANTAYLTNNASSYRDPYNYYLSGNVNFSFYSLNVPLSFSYSNQGKNFQHPFSFNQYGLSPSYRWITVHGGYRTMTFSPYTLNGHLFLGGGVDLAPKGKLKLSAMYGRLQKAIPLDTSNANQIPSFKRMGYGVKAGIESNNDQAYLILFKAWDDVNSLHLSPADSVPPELTPQENVALGFTGKKMLFKRLSLTVDWGYSALTRDVRAQSSEGSSSFQRLGGLYKVRSSSGGYHAIKTSLNYAADIYQIGLNYERIDPEYRTLGAYFFNNDLENITISNAIKLGKLALSSNVGLQRNDLDNKKASSMNRVVVSVNASLAPTERLQTSLSFSNFKSFTRTKPKFENLIGTPQQPLDTLSLKYVQISQSANMVVTYQLGGKKNSLNTNFSLNKSEDLQDTTVNTTILYYATSTYNFSIPKTDLTGSTGVNVSWSDDPQGYRVAIGPVAQVSREFFEKKLRTNGSATYNVILINGNPGGGVMNIRLSGSYKMSKKHNFNMSLGEVLRRDKNKQSLISELTANLNYAYNF